MDYGVSCIFPANEYGVDDDDDDDDDDEDNDDDDDYDGDDNNVITIPNNYAYFLYYSFFC